MSEDEQEARDDELLDWFDALLLDADVGLTLVGTAGIAEDGVSAACSISSRSGPEVAMVPEGMLLKAAPFGA
jgi:hypothetical protein